MDQRVKLKVQLYRSENDLMWYYGVNIPAEIAEEFIDGMDRRVICTLPGGESFHCALFGASNGGYNILINKKRRTKLGLRTGEVFQIELEKDTSKYGVDMSEEFEAVLSEDEEAAHYFHELTPGKQRTLIYQSDNVKSSDIKIRRALVIMEHLKQERGELDYKRLNEMMKEANRAARRM